MAVTIVIAWAYCRVTVTWLRASTIEVVVVVMMLALVPMTTWVTVMLWGHWSVVMTAAM
jgi:hypothetical protein